MLVVLFSTLEQTMRSRVSDGMTASIVSGCGEEVPLLVMVWPQLGDFDSLEYAWWLRRHWSDIQSRQIQVRAVAIGDRASGQAFCRFTEFPEDCLYVDPQGALHQTLDLNPGLKVNVPGLSTSQKAWLNLILMCAGIGSPGTLAEVFRGYRGDRNAPQLIDSEETIKAAPLPEIKGKFFDQAGGAGFQRPFELATLRLRNMAEVLGKWKTYVPDASHLTQRGGTFLFNGQRELLYEFRDPGILGFSATMNRPLDFLWSNLND